MTGDDVQAVSEVLRGDWLTGGPTVSRFEDAVAAFCGVKYAIAVSNGTAALHVACLALGVQPGQTGLTSPLTFLASANCLAYCGAKPDFADIDPGTYCLSPSAVEAYIKEHDVPKVVIPVDFAGVPADLPSFRQLADQYGFALIEDAAHALGSEYSAANQWFRCGCCRHTDISILSFHPVKTMTTAEGGMVLTNDPVLAKRARMFANHGLERDELSFVCWSLENSTGSIGDPGTSQVKGNVAPWLYQQQVLGYNYRLTDMQCALGLSQLNRLESFISRRQDIVCQYNQAFSGHPCLGIPPWPQASRPAYHLYPLRVYSTNPQDRRRLALHLKSMGILTQVHYIPVHLQPWYRDNFGYQPGKCPEAEAFYQSCLSLPLFPAMTEIDVRRVIHGVIDFVNELVDSP